MRSSLLVPCLASLLALSSSCTKDKTDKKSADNVTSDDGAARPAKSEAPIDTSKSDALWAMAPQGAVLGMVAVPGTGTRLHEMGMEMLRIMGSRPLGAKLMVEMREEAADLPVDIFNPKSFQKIGIDLSLGAAVFMTGEDEGYGVFPVSDREAFRKITEGTLETVDGLEVDKHDDDLFCLPKDDFYACAHSVAALKEFGHAVNGPLAQRVAKLPNTYRGDAEIVVDVAAVAEWDDGFDPEFHEYFEDPGLGVGAFRFGEGAVSMRGWFQAKTRGVLSAASTVPSTLGKAAMAQHPAALFNLRIPTEALMKDMPPGPDEVLPGGVKLKEDVLGNFTGEFVAVVPSSKTLWGRISWGIKKPDAYKTLLNTGCGLAAMAGPGVKSILEGARCELTVDFSKLPLPAPEVAQMFPEPLSLSLEVKDDQIAMTIGKEAPIDEGARLSSLGRELVNKNWNYALWAQNISVVAGLEEGWDAAFAGLPDDAVEGVKMATWALAQVNEVGMAGAIRDDGVHFIWQVGTYAGDPEDAYQAYQAAVTKAIDGGDATEDFATIAKKWPKSMAAQSANAGSSVLVASVTGMLAAVAIPAFVKYQKLSAESALSIETEGGDTVRVTPGGGAKAIVEPAQ